MTDAPETAGPTFYRDADDIVWRGIEADMEAGRCWACRCEPGEPHKPHCPEGTDNGSE